MTSVGPAADQPQLFETGEHPAEEIPEPTARLVRVVPADAPIDREFDYRVPTSWSEPVVVGTPVRIRLAGRPTGGWVTAVDVEPSVSGPISPLVAHGGRGPEPLLVDVASWAARRFVGRRAHFLNTATPPRRVRRPTSAPPATRPSGEVPLEPGVNVARVPPAGRVLPLVQRAAELGPVLVIVPTAGAADRATWAMRRAGIATARWPDEAARSFAGWATVGTRSAAWATVADLAAIVVVDEHDESLQSQAAPTWHAREVAIERTRRAGIPLLLTSPAPSQEALAVADRLIEPTRTEEYQGWPLVELVDRRGDEPGPGTFFSSRLVELVRSDARVICLLNRTGRARLLVCGRCETVAGCESCGAAVELGDAGELLCPLCQTQRPLVCVECGSVRLKRLRPGTRRLAEELAALIGEPVDEVSGKRGDREPESRVVVGTEAVAHRVDRADVVIMLDADQELMAPRFRAEEQLVWLAARAARLLGPRRRGGRLVLQTRRPDHPVLAALVRARPGELAEAERERRRRLNLPPHRALARLSGPEADAAATRLGERSELTVLGPHEGAYLVGAPDAEILGAVLCTELGAGVRIQVDPPRI